jgi:hypothetical protein
MPLSVVKPFKSINRKFAEGDMITAADIDPGTVMRLDDLIAGGFVKDSAAAAPISGIGSFKPLADKPDAE